MTPMGVPAASTSRRRGASTMMTPPSALDSSTVRFSVTVRKISSPRSRRPAIADRAVENVDSREVSLGAVAVFGFGITTTGFLF